jgi:hypothetical protein
VQLRELVDEIQLTEQKGVVMWKWCSSGAFSSRSAYTVMFLGQSAMPEASILWKIKAPAENKFFLWLAMQDHCWTKDRFHRHNLSDDAHARYARRVMKAWITCW